MKKKLGFLSAILFYIALASYFVYLFRGVDQLLLISFLIGLAGFVLALFGEKGTDKRIGIVGNGLMMTVVIILPFIVTSLFWNQP